MIPGVVFNLGGTDYTVPPLFLREYFAHESELAILGEPGKHPMKEFAEAARTVLLAVLRRNYPDMTADTFDEIVPIGQLVPLIGAVFSQSGFASRPLTESAPSTSPAPNSSDSSTPPPDGGPTTSSTG
jgi:hypothetical protein